MRLIIYLVSVLLAGSGLRAQESYEQVFYGVQNQLTELTYETWTDEENWLNLIQYPHELVVDVLNGNSDEHYAVSVQLLESAIQPIEDWSQLDLQARSEYLSSVGYYFITSIILLKLSITLKERLSHEIQHRILRRFSFRQGPVEPARLPRFLYSEAYEKFRRELNADGNLRRLEKRKLRAFFRAKAIFRVVQDARFRLDRPNIETDWESWDARFEEAYQSYRRERAEARWRRMPKLHRRRLGPHTPHLDEALKAVLDFTRETLSRQEQRALLRHLEKLAYDYTRLHRPQDRLSFSLSVNRFMRRHPEVFRFLVRQNQEAVRMDDRFMMSALGLRVPDRSREELEDYAKKLRAEFRRFLCGTKFQWLGR